MATPVPKNRPQTTSPNQRQTQRDYPRRTGGTLRGSAGQVTVQFLDESDGGVGTYASEAVPFATNDQVSVECPTEPTRLATICYIRPLSFGGFHLGLHWLDQ